MAWSILDVYSTSQNKVYVDINPATYFENKNYEIEIVPKSKEFKIHSTPNYNVASFLELEFSEIPRVLTIDKQEYEVKEPNACIIPIDLQLCLVFKNEWHRIPLVLEYYKRVHKVQRFILYDNQSTDPIPAEILAREDVIYHKWDIPYKHTISDPKLLKDDYGGPQEIIIAQNSAYSHCLKRYRDAIWTTILDTDEFIVRRRDNEPLLSLVKMTSPAIHSIVVRGFWSGCNSVQRDKLYENLRKITKRSPNFCMNKLILRTAEHVFTNCIHSPYPTKGKLIMLAYERGYYFFHLYTASAKLRRCDCQKYCRVADRSFQESFAYM